MEKINPQNLIKSYLQQKAQLQEDPVLGVIIDVS